MTCLQPRGTVRCGHSCLAVSIVRHCEVLFHGRPPDWAVSTLRFSQGWLELSCTVFYRKQDVPHAL